MSREKLQTFLGFLLLIVIVSGCTTTNMRTIQLQSDPTDVEVRASTDFGMQDMLLGRTPFTYDFSFKTSPQYGPTIYNLNFSKLGYIPETIILKGDEPSDIINVKLDRDVVQEIDKLELAISEEEGMGLVRRKVRAWIEDIERDGTGASSIVRLESNQSIIGMALSPTGETLYFSIAGEVKDEQGNIKSIANIRSVSSSGGGMTLVTSGQWLDTFPACSTDGQHIIFCSNRMRNKWNDIFQISSKERAGIAVVRQTSEGINLQPSKSQNDIMVFHYLPIYQGGKQGTKQIWTLGGPNQYPTQLKEGSMPSISPDGNFITYIGIDSQLWVVPINGLNPVQLTNGPIQREGKLFPSWAPDGETIVFASDEGLDGRNEPNYDIWMIKRDGTGLRQLTTNGSEDNFPIVSPDRNYIYFVSNRGFNEGIWRIPFPTSNP